MQHIDSHGAVVCIHLWTRLCSSLNTHLWKFAILEEYGLVHETMNHCSHICIYMYIMLRYHTQSRNVFHILVAMQDCKTGLRGISNTISFTAPLNSTLVWLCLALGVQLITRLNLGGYIPSSSLTLSSSLELSPLTKKSMSLSRIYTCSAWSIHFCIIGTASEKCASCYWWYCVRGVASKTRLVGQAVRLRKRSRSIEEKWAAVHMSVMWCSRVWSSAELLVGQVPHLPHQTLRLCV